MVSKKVLKIGVLKRDYQSHYSHTGLMFAYCSKITDNRVEQLSGFCGCREDLAGCLFHDTRGKIHINRSRYIVRHITSDTNTTVSEKWFNRATEAGLGIVNIMEARHGWPLTKMLDAESSVFELKASCGSSAKRLTTFRKVLLGSNKWVRSPHMISLYILLLRLGTRNKFSSIKNYKKFAKVCGKCGSGQIGDMGHVARTFKFWDLIMANFDKVFAGLRTRDNFTKARYYSDYAGYYNEGVSKLCNFQCSHKAINSRFVALANKANLV